MLKILDAFSFGCILSVSAYSRQFLIDTPCGFVKRMSGKMQMSPVAYQEKQRDGRTHESAQIPVQRK